MRAKRNWLQAEGRVQFAVSQFVYRWQFRYYCFMVLRRVPPFVQVGVYCLWVLFVHLAFLFGPWLLAFLVSRLFL